MHTLYLLSVYLHVLAAMTWLGGMIFLVVVIVPMLRKPELRDRAIELVHLLGIRFRTVGWAALGTLVVTGVFNVAHRGYGLAELATGSLFAGHWGRTLAHKLTLVAVILVISAVHDFWVGPTATRLAREGAPPAQREKFRKAASVMGRVNFALALAVVALAITLVR